MECNKSNKCTIEQMYVCRSPIRSTVQQIGVLTKIFLPLTPENRPFRGLGSIQMASRSVI